MIDKKRLKDIDKLVLANWKKMKTGVIEPREPRRSRNSFTRANEYWSFNSQQQSLQVDNTRTTLSVGDINRTFEQIVANYNRCYNNEFLISWRRNASEDSYETRVSQLPMTANSIQNSHRLIGLNVTGRSTLLELENLISETISEQMVSINQEINNVALRNYSGQTYSIDTSQLYNIPAQTFQNWQEYYGYDAQTSQMTAQQNERTAQQLTQDALVYGQGTMQATYDGNQLSSWSRVSPYSTWGALSQEEINRLANQIQDAYNNMAVPRINVTTNTDSVPAMVAPREMIIPNSMAGRVEVAAQLVSAGLADPQQMLTSLGLSYGELTGSILSNTDLGNDESSNN